MPLVSCIDTTNDAAVLMDASIYYCGVWTRQSVLVLTLS